MEDLYCKILTELRNNSVVSLGGSEVVGVAYAVSLAKERVQGNLKNIEITVDSSVFKNGLNVIIPGTGEKGLDMAAALGYVCGDSSLQFQSISNLSKENIEQARDIINMGKIAIKVKDSCDSMFIEVLLETDIELIRITIFDFRFKSVIIEKVKLKDDLAEFIIQPINKFMDKKNISLQDIYQFIKDVDSKDLEFINEGVAMNIELSKAIDTMPSIASSLKSSFINHSLNSNLISDAQNMCMSACEAKMKGIKLPIMTAVGSANFGIITYLCNYSVAKSLNKSNDELYKAIALSNLVSLYVKSKVGTLSSICGCGIFTGVGVSASVCYLLGGEFNEILLAMKSMISSITGIICDGNKRSCIWKLGLSVDWAIKSALLAMDEDFMDEEQPTVDEINEIFENIGVIYSSFDKKSNQSIVDVLVKNASL